MTALESLLIAQSRLRKVPIWWVGGPVRDEVLQRPWLDGDVACRGALALAKSISRKVHGKLIVLDDQYRIYRVIIPEGGYTLDVAELQGRTIEEDLARRDFTINAMARLVGTSTIIDPWKGIKDLKRKTVRTLSLKVLKEDPVRRLRAFRFAAQLNFKIDPKTLAWVRKGSLSTIAAERIREEFLKLLVSPQTGSTLDAMDRAGLLIEIIEELEACRWTARSFYGSGGVLRHSLNTVKNLEWILGRLTLYLSHKHADMVHGYLHEPIGGHPRLAWLKLGALLHDIGKPATAKKIGGRLRFFGHEEVGADMAGPFAKRLRLSRQETQLVRSYVKHHMRLGSLAAASAATPKALFRYFRDLGGSEGVGMILISLADHYDYLNAKKWGKKSDPVEKLAIRMLDTFYADQALMKPQRLITGHDIMRVLRLKPSPQIGDILEKVQDAQVDGKIKSKDEALAFVKALALSVPSTRQRVVFSPRRGPSR